MDAKAKLELLMSLSLRTRSAAAAELWKAGDRAPAEALLDLGELDPTVHGDAGGCIVEALCEESGPWLEKALAEGTPGSSGWKERSAFLAAKRFGDAGRAQACARAAGACMKELPPRSGPAPASEWSERWEREDRERRAKDLAQAWDKLAMEALSEKWTPECKEAALEAVWAAGGAAAAEKVASKLLEKAQSGGAGDEAAGISEASGEIRKWLDRAGADEAAISKRFAKAAGAAAQATPYKPKPGIVAALAEEAGGPMACAEEFAKALDSWSWSSWNWSGTGEEVELRVRALELILASGTDPNPPTEGRGPRAARSTPLFKAIEAEAWTAAAAMARSPDCSADGRLVRRGEVCDPVAACAMSGKAEGYDCARSLAEKGASLAQTEALLKGGKLSGEAASVAESLALARCAQPKRSQGKAPKALPAGPGAPRI